MTLLNYEGKNNYIPYCFGIVLICLRLQHGQRRWKRFGKAGKRDARHIRQIVSSVTKILILTSSTGGGHDMRARSLAQWAKHESPPQRVVETKIFSTLESGSDLYRFGVDLYNSIQKVAPWFHHLYFGYLECAQMHRYAEQLQGTDAFISCLQSYQPDIIVSVHAHLNHGYFQLAKRVLGQRVPCVTYCGELFGGYGFSHLWANPQVDYFFGAVPATTQEARALGVPESRSRTAGFLLHPDFYRTYTVEEKQVFAQEMALDMTRFRLVLATGANAANNHLCLLQALEKKKLPIQVIVLCGKNKTTREEVTAFANKAKSIRVLALPYFTRMSILMQSASAIVARPGTGTTSEAIMAGCPIIFNGMGGIMPQEWITIKYARSQHFGASFKHAASCANIVAEYFNSPTRLQKEKERLHALRPNSSPAELLTRLINLTSSPG